MHRPSGPRLLLAVALLASTLASQTQGALAAVGDPTLELRKGASSVEYTKFKGEPVYLDLGIFLASPEQPFELRAVRPSYSEPVELTQVIYGPGDSVREVDLPEDILDGWMGLEDFYRIEVKKLDGTTVVDTTSTFCPNGYDRQRIGENGPAAQTYPEACWSNPFTRGMVWGIDADWAVAAMGYGGPPMQLRTGRYVATVSITERYLELFGIDPAKSAATVDLRLRAVEADEPGCPECPVGSHRRQMRATADVPTQENPTAASLPDLASLPAWGISVRNGRRNTYLSFGATVWNSGPAPLMVEGFRREGEDVMDGYQYFYENGEPVGKDQVGTLEYDERDGHTHWHFQQFAGYSLLNADQSEVVRSKKEAFCLAPTDPIDITIPNAERQPYSIGLGSSCGQPSSLWIRETLPVGWGDTYFQGRPGQSFKINDLPNGTYFISVEANPGNLLHEASADNNIELREITIKGRPGNRRVVVPPWNGIDTESGI